MKKEFWDEAEEKALTTLVNKASRNKGQQEVSPRSRALVGFLVLCVLLGHLLGTMATRSGTPDTFLRHVRCAVQYGTKSWVELGERLTDMKLGPERSGKQCRNRYVPAPKPILQFQTSLIRGDCHRRVHYRVYWGL